MIFCLGSLSAMTPSLDQEPVRIGYQLDSLILLKILVNGLMNQTTKDY